MLRSLSEPSYNEYMRIYYMDFNYMKNTLEGKWKEKPQNLLSLRLTVKVSMRKPMSFFSSENYCFFF